MVVIVKLLNAHPNSDPNPDLAVFAFFPTFFASSLVGVVEDESSAAMPVVVAPVVVVSVAVAVVVVSVVEAVVCCLL